MRRAFFTVVLALAVPWLFACSPVLVGKKASATGRVIVAHNEDDVAEGLVVRHALVPAQTWPVGTRVPCEKGCAAIPQVAATRGFYWSEVTSSAVVMSSADAFYNDAGVFVCSNNGNGGGPDEPAAACVAGGLKYVLRRAVAERAVSARDAVAVITNLVSTWGYACPGRMYTVADADEAWVVQIVKGRRYVARRCPDDAVVALPNCYTIRTLLPDDIVSPDIAACAKDAPDFDFAATYQRSDRVASPKDVFRWRHMLRILAQREIGPDALPFAVKPLGPVTPERVQAALSTHFEGSPDAVVPTHGAGAATVPRSAVCRDSTVECTVCLFAADPRETQLRVAVGPPCKTPFVTFAPFSSGLPASWPTRANPAAALAAHCN